MVIGVVIVSFGLHHRFLQWNAIVQLALNDHRVKLSGQVVLQLPR